MPQPAGRGLIKAKLNMVFDGWVYGILCTGEHPRNWQWQSYNKLVGLAMLRGCHAERQTIDWAEICQLNAWELPFIVRAAHKYRMAYLFLSQTPNDISCCKSQL